MIRELLSKGEFLEIMWLRKQDTSICISHICIWNLIISHLCVIFQANVWNELITTLNSWQHKKWFVHHFINTDILIVIVIAGGSDLKSGIRFEVSTIYSAELIFIPITVI